MTCLWPHLWVILWCVILCLSLCVIQIEDREMLADLILMDMYDYDVILGMDWLVAYHAGVDCFGKVVVFQPLGEPNFDLRALGCMPYLG